MRILIIGGTSFTGPHIVRRLSDMGHDILLFHRGQTKTELPPGVEYLYGDRGEFADYADELQRFAPHIVLDMIPISEADARVVMETFRGVAERVVAISSQDVYRAYGVLIGIEEGSLEPIPLDETAPLRKKIYPYREQVTPDHRLYHYDKILIERTCLGDPELPGTILHYPMVYGAGDRQHRLFEYLKRMDDGRPAILLEQGAANWRWTKGYSEDMAAAVVLAVTDERAAGRIYNVGESEAMNEMEWVRTIGEAVGWQGEVIALPKERMPEHLLPEHNTDQGLVTSTNRIREELGYKEVIPQDEALMRTVTWERENPPEQVDESRFNYKAEDEVLDSRKAP